MRGSWEAAFLAVILSYTMAQCPPDGPTLQPSSAFSLARNVLLGRDITPPKPCSFADLALCRRRQIQFEVFCTLKKTDNFSPQPEFFIGENRTVEQCDATFMEYNSRNKIMVALVTYKKMANGQGYLDWNEVVPGRSAIYEYDDVTINSDLNATCGLDEFLRGSNSGAFCPPQAPRVKCHSRFTNVLTVVFQNSKEGILGVQCCRLLSTRQTDISVNETSTNAVVPSYATATMPSVYLGVLREDFFFGSNALVTVAMVTSDNSRTITHWLVSNVKFANDGQLLIEGGLTVVPYTGIVPEEKVMDGQIQIFRQNGLVQNASFPLCTSACKMDIAQWRRDNDLSLYTSAKMKVAMDDFAIWNLISKMNSSPRNICRKFDSSLEAHGDTVLCPKETTGGATTQKLFPVSLLCLFLTFHVMFN